MDSLFNQLQVIKTFFAGKKTYLVGAAMFLTALEKYVTGATTLSQFLATVQGLLGFNGLAVLAMRAAVSKIALVKKV
jgi:hypothetical protein